MKLTRTLVSLAALTGSLMIPAVSVLADTTTNTGQTSSNQSKHGHKKHHHKRDVKAEKPTTTPAQ